MPLLARRDCDQTNLYRWPDGRKETRDFPATQTGAKRFRRRSGPGSWIAACR